MRRRLTVFLCAAVLAPAVTRGQTVKDSVAAAAHEFLKALSASDTAALGALLRSDGVLYSIRETPNGTAMRKTTAEAFLASLATDHEAFLERMWDPTVLVQGAMATVWAPYDFHRGGAFSHCGIDAFMLVRDRGRWRVSSITYTIETTGCKASPLGAPKPPSSS